LLKEGYVDVNRATGLGKALEVDVVIIGNYTVLTNKVNLLLKAIDVRDGIVVALNTNELPINDEVKVLLDNNSSSSENNVIR